MEDVDPLDPEALSVVVSRSELLAYPEDQGPGYCHTRARLRTNAATGDPAYPVRLDVLAARKNRVVVLIRIALQ